MAGEKIGIKAPLGGFSSKLHLLLLFFLISIAVPLPGWGQDAPSSSKANPKSQEKSDKATVIEAKSFLILKNRLDRLSKQTSKHEQSSSPGIPEYVETGNFNLPDFPEISEKDTIEERLLMLKKRLETLQDALHRKP